jgi:hypothetical protein
LDIALYNKRENNEIVKKSILITTKTNNDMDALFDRKVDLITEKLEPSNANHLRRLLSKDNNRLQTLLYHIYIYMYYLVGQL